MSALDAPSEALPVSTVVANARKGFPFRASGIGRPLNSTNALRYGLPFRSGKKAVEGSGANAQLPSRRTLTQRACFNRRSDGGELASDTWAQVSGRAADPNTSPARIAHALSDPLGDESSFELGHGSENGQKQLTFR